MEASFRNTKGPRTIIQKMLVWRFKTPLLFAWAAIFDRRDFENGPEFRRRCFQRFVAATRQPQREPYGAVHRGTAPKRGPMRHAACGEKHGAAESGTAHPEYGRRNTEWHQRPYLQGRSREAAWSPNTVSCVASLKRGIRGTLADVAGRSPVAKGAKNEASQRAMQRRFAV